MDRPLLSQIFRNVILRHGQLILPFMGCIKMEDVPASISEGGLVVTPPSKRLYFDNYNLSSNDILLNEYAAVREISRMAAKKALYADIDEIRQEAESEGSFELEGFGMFVFDKDKGYTIETSPDFMISRETFGLSTIDLREEEKKEAERKAEQEKAEQEKAEQERVEAEQERIEAERRAEEEHPSRSSKWLWALLTFVGILIICCLLIYIFKEDLRPYLERILYTKEELDILNYKL